MLSLLLDYLIVYIVEDLVFSFLEIQRCISYVAHTGLYTKAMF